MKIVNSTVKKLDSIAAITGTPGYTEDLILNNNTLIVKLLRSPHAYGKIIDIDVSAAKKIVGIENIFTHLDTPKTRFTLAGQGYPEPSAYDRRILDEYVRYVGDAVAIVVGENEKCIDMAMKLVKVKYELYTPILDYEKSIDSKTVVHQEELFTNFDIGMEKNRNIASKYFQEKEGVDEGFKNSSIVIEETYYTQGQIHGMMETNRSYSYFDSYGRLTIITSTQIPFHVRRHLARALEISPGKIRVIKPRVGGGFGGKQTAATEIYTAFVTLKTGKPSKMIYNRKENNTCTTTRHPMRITVKIGSDLEGNIKAIDIKTLSNTGAYGEHAPTVTPLIAFKTFPLYSKIPMRFKADIVYSNTMVGGAFRGYGATQGTFAVESAINELAEKLNIDPIDLRMKNLVETNLEGESIVSGDIKKCITIGKEKFDWKNRRNRREISDGKVRAGGMAVTMQGSGIAGIDTAAVTIKLSDRGDFNLFTGVTDMGQGCDTVISQMASEVLEVSLDKIIIHSADTDVSPYDPGAYASSGTYVTGNATIIACNKMKEEILKTTSKLLNIPQEQIEFCGEFLRVKENDKAERILKLEELAQKFISFEGMNQITTTGTWGGKTSPPPFIGSFAEVEVDTGTGEVKILDFLSVVDCGTLINPALARVQVEGGIVQGIGLALTEDIIYGKNGKVLTDSFMQYKMPARKDIGKIDVEFLESYEPTGPFGAKSVGEVVINTSAPAIADAIFRATGKRIRSLPITSEKILMGK